MVTQVMGSVRFNNSSPTWVCRARGAAAGRNPAVTRVNPELKISLKFHNNYYPVNKCAKTRYRHVSGRNNNNYNNLKHKESYNLYDKNKTGITNFTIFK